MTLSTNKEKYKVLLAAVLIILSLLAMGLKICIGLDNEMAALQFSGTFSAGRQWIDYYTIGKRELPDYIYVDTRYYPDITMFFSTPFGQFIKDRYVEQSLEPGAEYYILKKKALQAVLDCSVS